MTLHPLDLIVLVAYMLGVTAFGWYFGRKQRDIRDYFLSDRDVPWWALAGSIVATETSTVTFISVPAFAFAANARGEGGNFTFLQLVFGYMIGRLIIVALFIPLYFRGELFTVYQVLDRRFGGRVKRVAASLFLITRSLADGIRLYATALVLVALTGWADPTSILIIGAVTIFYTYLGGMAAVIWTDVVQLLIYIGGALVAAAILLGQIPGGWHEVIAVGSAFDKFRLFDFTFDLARSYTFWSGVVGGAFLTTATHGTDQLMVQRYLCSRNARQATGALLASGAIIFAQFVLFLFIGVMLFVFYHRFPALLPAEVAAKADRIFPHFIVTQLPVGIVGLVIAAIFAAAMSTLSSSLNSSAATALTDFYRPLLAPQRSETHYLTVSRALTAGWGVVQIAVAIAAIAMEQRVVDAVLSIASFTNGPILGLFFSGALTKRIGPLGALIGVVSGIAVMILVWAQTAISWQWYVLIGSLVTFIIAYLASLIFEREPIAVEQPID
ncbi:sodium:solute symporter [Pyrinomonas methylaliphatogenes]|jgi:SSS family transporter|uniref:SSS sodium solute transporter n=1 Tax=Pyrinomonas methylaliphatogenes TaxID=454194 RepID=A0A0B6WVZ4_9BACT|nr:sodium:solute symporter [Pyrinomonas methylaliphatogenes]CDM65443.1 SSS sodium solute transporter [Pyrinomonas methylaliphatogenes]